MLLATSDSDAAKNPRLRFSVCRSSSVNPSLLFHRAMSACIETSVGIQWLLQPLRYFSQAHLYFSGSSWFTSARQLIIALSSTETRPPERSSWPRPAAPLPSDVTAAGMGLGRSEDQSRDMSKSLCLSAACPPALDECRASRDVGGGRPLPGERAGWGVTGRPRSRDRRSGRPVRRSRAPRAPSSSAPLPPVGRRRPPASPPRR